MSDVSLILDIGNGSVGAALVKYEQSSNHQSPTILYSHREPLAFLSDTNEKHLLANMLDLLKTVLGQAQKEMLAMRAKKTLDHGRFRHTMCVFSSPWYISQTSVITKEAEEAFHITNAVVNEIVDKEEARFAQGLERGDYEKYFGAKVVLLERVLVHTSVNGYEVASPVGEYGRALEITLFTSLISEKVLRLVEEAFYKTFHIAQIECFSYALVSWNAVRTMFPEAADFLFLDVSGETSDVTLTVHGAITETVSFPFGRATILRTLVDTLKISPETAVSFIKMRALGMLEKEMGTRLEKALQVVGNQWITVFNTALSTISKKYNLPKRVFVTVDPDLSSFFSGILNRADIGPALFKGPFDVTIVAGEAIASFIQQSSPAIPDSTLALEAIFLGNKAS